MLIVGRRPLFQTSKEFFVGGGGLKSLPFCLGTAYNVCSMEDIGNSWLLRWQWDHTSQNYLSLFQIWALAPLQIHASLCEGPIFLIYVFYHELQCLVSPWSLKVFCIYVWRSQKGLARYHLVISYHDCFEKVLSSNIYYYDLPVDYAIDMSTCETWELLQMWLVMIYAKNLNAGLT